MGRMKMGRMKMGRMKMGRMGKMVSKKGDTRPAENNPIFLKAVRLHGRPPARPLGKFLGFEKTRFFFGTVLSFLYHSPSQKRSMCRCRWS